jgi:hypothetical protein
MIFGKKFLIAQHCLHLCSNGNHNLHQIQLSYGGFYSDQKSTLKRMIILFDVIIQLIFLSLDIQSEKPITSVIFLKK